MKVIIGYINKFEYHYPVMRELLSRHPKEGMLYRILFDDNDDSPFYQVYIGRDKNKAKMDTIHLGPTLSGNYEDKWTFDISEVTPDNYLDFTFSEAELKKLHKWLKSDNSDLNWLLEKTTTRIPIPADDEAKIPTTDPSMEEPAMPATDRAIEKVLNFGKEIDAALVDMSTAINTIIDKDIRIMLVLSPFLKHIAATYDDKYENTGKTNIAKDFLLSSSSPDTAIFNCIKYVQRYSTTGFEKSGKIIDIYKAMHYLIFELQRQRQQNDKK